MVPRTYANITIIFSRVKRRYFSSVRNYKTLVAFIVDINLTGVYTHPVYAAAAAAAVCWPKLDVRLSSLINGFT